MKKLLSDEIDKQRHYVRILRFLKNKSARDPTGFLVLHNSHQNRQRGLLILR